MQAERDKIGFIGAGNIASAIIRSATSKGLYAGSDIMVINKRNRDRIQALQAECGVSPAKDLREMARFCSVLVIAVKPDQVPEVLDGLAGALDGDHLLVSVAAGVTLGYIEAAAGAEVPVIRAMPNTPALVGEGVVALSAGGRVTPLEREKAEKILGGTGKVYWVDESLLDVITALSGSGPAYFYALAAEMAAAAGKMGLDPELAEGLARQTLVGAGHLLKTSRAGLGDLMKQVTSPNGTTAAALKAFEDRRLDLVVEEAMAKAAARSREISGMPGRHALTKSRRIVVKVGSSTITGEGGLNPRVISGLVAQIASLRAEGREVLLVSSGAMAAGRGKIGSALADTLTGKQVLSAVGQGLLMQTYESLFGARGITVAQVLLTREDLSSPKRSSLCRNTLAELTARGIVPIINENDAVAVDEIKLGDNDTLSARVAVLVSADLLILLTDTDGLYTKDPRRYPDARLLTTVNDIDPGMLGMLQENGTPPGTEGMATKLWAANLAVEHGIPAVIANGTREDVLQAIVGGREVGTFISNEGRPGSTLRE